MKANDLRELNDGELANRLRLSGRLVLGLTQLAPGPASVAAPVAGNPKARGVPDSLYGPHGGLGFGLDYDTRLDHFAVGFDIMGRFTVASVPDSGSFSLLSIAFLPRIRYVF